MNAKQRDDLLKTLEARFNKHMHRHPKLSWAEVAKQLTASPAKLKAVQAMENSGGDPDVVVLGSGKSAHTGLCDCASESPAGRRSLCYDRAALDSRKQAKPRGSAMEMAAELGIEMLTPEQYHALQALEPFDRKTSSWLQTPANIRKLGGAVFGDRRYDQVFVYHNGAESYYAVRGFRGFVAL